MLVQLRVENHRSLRDEQALSLVASSLGDRGDPRLLAATGLEDPLLPAVALYGANASGKTNVLHALAFMADAVLKSHRLWEPGSGPPREPFVLSDRAAEPSRYEVDILLGGVRYRYGFVLGEGGVDAEWLHAWPHGRKQVWLAREGVEFKFGKHLGGENELIRKVTRVDSLFLSAAAQNNHAQLAPIFAWFQAAHFELRRSPAAPLDPRHILALEHLFADSRQGTLFESEDDLFRARQRANIVRLLRTADLGIRDLELRPREPGGARTRAGPGRVRFDLFFRHQTADQRDAWLPVDSESAGTLALLGLATRIVEVLHRGALLCVDELEASLHTSLALGLLHLFHSRESNPRGAQLIFTTHDTNLLGTNLGDPPLRRDQVWFTEKDDAGATHLYPLTEFHPRKDENLERGYLQGRYGAIPCLGDLAPDPGDSSESP